MPRVKLGTPEVDKVKGLILERQLAYGYSEAKMAKLVGCSESTWRKMIRERSTKEWTLGEILKLTHALGIPKDEVRAAI